MAMTTEHNEITLTKRSQSKVVRPLSLSSRIATQPEQQPHKFMIIADAIYYNGTQPDRIFYNGAKIWEKTTTPITPSYGSKTLAGKFIDDSMESDWEFWPNGVTGASSTSIKDYVKPDTKEFNFDYNDTLTSCKYLYNGNLSIAKLERIDHTPDTSNVTNMEYMFANNRQLASVNVSDLDTSKVTSMRSMFQNCKILPNLDLSNFDTSNVTNMGYMFSDCNALSTLDLSNFDTSNVTNMTNMFAACQSLTTLNLFGWDTSKVVSMGVMFSGCDSLSTILGPITGIKISLVFVQCPLDNASAMVLINGLAEVTSTRTITFNRTTFDTLTPEQIAVATSKGWDVVCF